MKYFIGASIPNSYKNKIELLRAEFRFFSTEPHITIVPPPALPDDDIFINDVVEVCKKFKGFNITLNNLGQFGKRVLYVNVISPDLTILHDKIYDILNLKKENRGFTPHLTVVKQRPKRFVDIDLITERAEKKLFPYPSYSLNSIVIYHQPKERSVYVPYIEIPFNDGRTITEQ